MPESSSLAGTSAKALFQFRSLILRPRARFTTQYKKMQRPEFLYAAAPHFI
jgi:hypothetical protein